MSNRLDRFYTWAERLERYLARGVVLAILALVAVQALMSDDVARGYLSAVERLEGRRIDVAAHTDGRDPARPASAAADRQGGRVAIHLINRETAPRVYLRVNGTPVAAFGQPRVEARVRPDDFLEIDATADPSQLAFRVTFVERSLISPELGRQVTTRGDLVPLGKVAPAP